MALSGFAAGLAAELEQVRQAAGDIYVANLCTGMFLSIFSPEYGPTVHHDTVAAAVWLGYDILATLPEEVSSVELHGGRGLADGRTDIVCLEVCTRRLPAASTA